MKSNLQIKIFEKPFQYYNTNKMKFADNLDLVTCDKYKSNVMKIMEIN